MVRFHAVLLDYTNTVVQFDRPQIEGIHARLAEHLSRTLGPVEAAALGEVMDRVCVRSAATPQLRELTATEQMRRILQDAYGRPFQEADPAVAAADRAYQDLFVASLRVDARTVSVLRALHAIVRVGLVSNYPCGRSLRRSLAALGIAGDFDPVVVSGEVGWIKPHPEPFRIAVEGLGVPAERVLLVGDDWACDMVGGRDAGMATCHHVGLSSCRDHDRCYSTYRPDFTIRNLEEILPILRAA
ncbi:MAG: hypothetical protein QOJ46_786 [bacterium]|jgi:HAD superfamily hydrolase (TIGR01509 family)